MERKTLLMSDLEFDVLDELYFVQPFSELVQSTQLEEDLLKKVLKKLIVKQFVKCLNNATDEIPADEVDFDKDYRRMVYLATKSGLLAHNSQ